LPVRIVDQPGSLDVAVREIAGSQVIALDTESNSLHRYPEQLCLIQVATLSQIYIIDTISLEAVTPLKEILQDGSIIKVIHGADYDIRSLDRYGGLRVRNIYDTYIAARFAGVPKVGLADLLKDLLGVTIPKSKQLQHADWGLRPLSSDAVEYAATDVRHLLALREILDQRLQSLGRSAWVSEECSRLENVRYTPPNPETAFLSVKGAQHLNGCGLAVLKQLYLFREEEARRQHRPPFFVIPDGALVYLSSNPAGHLTDVPGLGQNGFQRFGNLLQQAIREGQKVPPVERPPVTYEPLSPGQAQLLSRLKAWRASIALKLALDPSLLWPTASLERIARAPDMFPSELNSSCVRCWQREQFASSLEALLKSLA
jgi:ribonuclease D